MALAYRNQWANSNARSQIGRFSYDQYVHPIRGGVGVNVQYEYPDSARHNFKANLSYAPAFRLFKGKLLVSPAVTVGFEKTDQYNYYYPYRYICVGPYPIRDSIIGVTGVYYFDMSGGIIFSHNNLSYGLAVHHLTEPDEGYGGTSRLPRKFTGHISYMGVVNDRLKFSPTMIYYHQQDFQVLYPSFTAYWRGVRLGGGMRFTLQSPTDAIIMAGYTYKFFSIGYSVDIGLSALTTKTLLTHEASLQFRFNCKNKERGRKGTSMWGM